MEVIPSGRKGDVAEERVIDYRSESLIDKVGLNPLLKWRAYLFIYLF